MKKLYDAIPTLNSRTDAPCWLHIQLANIYTALRGCHVHLQQCGQSRIVAQVFRLTEFYGLLFEKILRNAPYLSIY